MTTHQSHVTMLPMIPTPSEAIDRYEGELARRGRAKATRQKYREVLWPFADHLGRKSLQEITTDDCRRYLDRWVDASKSTIALYVSVVKGFLEFCKDEGWIATNPAEPLKRPKRPRPEDLAVVTVSASDVADKLMAACQDWDELLCVCGISYIGSRRNAIAVARRHDVDLAKGTIRLHEKGGKTVTKPIPDEFAAIISAADENSVWASGEDYLIPNRRNPRRRGERSNKVIYANVKRVAERAGVNVHPHALRAAFAVQFDEQNPGEIWALKELLGHARIETTLVYLRRKDRAKAMESVRSLRWGASVFPPNPGMPPAGFEPAFGDDAVPEPVRRKLDELTSRSSSRSRRAQR